VKSFVQSRHAILFVCLCVLFVEGTMSMQILQALASSMEFMDEFESSSLHFSKKKILFMHYNYKKKNGFFLIR
jgi:hypothetical protein